MKIFTDVLREIRKGRVVDKLSEDLAALVKAVNDTGKPGALTLTLTVKPEKGGGSQKYIQAKVSVKAPNEDLPEAIFFSDADGDLHRNDPDQREMFAETDKVGERSSRA